jgi:hypothetical protein
MRCVANVRFVARDARSTSVARSAPCRREDRHNLDVVAAAERTHKPAHLRNVNEDRFIRQAERIEAHFRPVMAARRFAVNGELYLTCRASVPYSLSRNVSRHGRLGRREEAHNPRHRRRRPFGLAACGRDALRRQRLCKAPE